MTTPESVNIRLCAVCKTRPAVAGAYYQPCLDNETADLDPDDLSAAAGLIHYGAVRDGAIYTLCGGAGITTKKPSEITCPNCRGHRATRLKLAGPAAEPAAEPAGNGATTTIESQRRYFRACFCPNCRERRATYLQPANPAAFLNTPEGNGATTTVIGYTAADATFCVNCVPLGKEVSKIFEGSEWNYLPTCAGCQNPIIGVTLTWEGRRVLADSLVNEMDHDCTHSLMPGWVAEAAIRGWIKRLEQLVIYP